MSFLIGNYFTTWTSKNDSKYESLNENESKMKMNQMKIKSNQIKSGKNESKCELLN